MFDQPELETLLRTNLKRYPNAELRGNVDVTNVAETSDGRIRVTFVDRTDKSEHHVDADYVLGCDGANSIVREQIGAAMRDLRFEQRWLVVDVATDADLDQWDGVHQVCDPVRAGTYMRIGPTRYRWEFRLLPGETADDFRSLDALKPLIAPWISRVDDDELELIRVTEYTFRAQIADRWRRGNIFLLGDAAHLTPPFIGQGMGAGLRDAMNLAWKLAGVIVGDLPAAMLDSYEQERKPHARQMIRLALGRRLVDDRRRAVRRSDAAPGRHAHALRPGNAEQDPRQPHAGPAPLGVRSAIARTRDNWPERCAPTPSVPAAGGWTTSSATASRSSPPWRPTTGSARCSTSAAPLSTSPSQEVNSPSGFAAAAPRRRSSVPTAP